MIPGATGYGPHSTRRSTANPKYHFDFELLTKDPSFESYLEFDSTPYDGILEEVVMFSGGIDSLGGAVQEAVIDKRKVILVNHRSTEKLSSFCVAPTSNSSSER